MDKQAMVALAVQVAGEHNLSGQLVCAVIEQESGWDAEATRYEPGFYAHYVYPLVEPEQLTAGEAAGRSTSWGLMQVLGQVARENGFVGPFQDLLDPEQGIRMGCTVLVKKIEAAGGDVYNGLLKWNGGGNKLYPQQVIDRMAHYESS